MLPSAFRGKKPVRCTWSIQSFHWKVKCYTIFKSFFSNMIGIAIFKYSPTSIKRLIQIGHLIEVQYKLEKNGSKNDFIDSIQQNAFKK